MSPTASTPSPVRDRHDLSFNNSQNSNSDSSTLCFESSFRLETPFPNQKAESDKHPKGKRKRTTSQDKTILEAAYSSNPKPDKAARLDIVKRVSLNEKEVQIWFQNRRQNDRRKSRPLSPQEIEALRCGNGMRVLSTDSIPASIEPVSSLPVLQDTVELPQSSAADAATPIEIGKRPLSPEDAGSQHRSRPPSSQVSETPKPIEDAKTDLVVEHTPSDTQPSPTEAAGPESESHTSSGVPTTSAGHQPNRWLAADSLSTNPTVEKSNDEWNARRSSISRIELGNSKLNSFSSSTSSAADNLPSILQPSSSSSSSSRVRLSLSLDGKAELISAQPSPPRIAPLPLLNTETLPPVFSGRTLQRSRSAFSGVTLPPISTLTKNLGAPFPPQFARGRSRDVHAWKSCCEADTRDELTRQAENESSGSAVAAISLMRSSNSSASLSNLIHNHRPTLRSPSQPALLQSNPNKRNTLSTARVPLDRKPSRTKPASPIHRCNSIEASEEMVDVERDEDALGPEKKKRKQSHRFILSPSGDSDKENWSPDEDGDPDHRRRLPLPEAPAVATKTGTGVPRNPRRIGHVLGEQDPATKRLFLNGSTDAKHRHMNRANTAPTPGPRMRAAGDAPLAIFEDGENTMSNENSKAFTRESKRNDDEVERFMRGEVSPSKRPDMDCIAGLLSLSQGNWR